MMRCRIGTSAARPDRYSAMRFQIDLKRRGMHLIARFRHSDDQFSDTDLARRAHQAGLNCRALSERCIAHDCDGGLLIGFANVASSDETHILSIRLHQALNMAETA